MRLKEGLKPEVTIETALRGVGKSARLKAFRRNRPIAISVAGRAFLIYPDGSRKPITKAVLQDLRRGKV